jgi:aldose 1-epimerase
VTSSISTIGNFDGEPVHEIALTNASGMAAKVMTWGAVVRDMQVPHRGGMQRVVLGFDSFAPYPVHSPHFGAIAGRYANRIDRGRFKLDGKRIQLGLNQNVPPGPGGTPTHHLHGGKTGFGKRNWTILHSTGDSVTLGLVSPDGEEGYPGTLTATCVYTLAAPATLRVELSATTDRPTIVNLAHHSYFNLDGAADVGDHLLTLDCGFRTPVGAGLIPTGEIASVAGSVYDFRKPRAMHRMTGSERLRFDDNFIRSNTGFGRCARVESPTNGLTMECWTDQPAVQFYDGAKVAVEPVGLDGARYGAHAGFCLEPQVYPDSPNRPHFTSAELWPGEVYSQLTEYRFA